MKNCSKTKGRGLLRRVFRRSAASSFRFESGVAALRSKTFRARNGATLIEVMLGMVILVIMVVVMITALRHPRFMMVSSAHKQAAIHAANTVLEEAVSQGYNYCYSNYLAVGSGQLLEPLGDYGCTMHDTEVSAQWSVEGWNGENPPILLLKGFANYPGGDAPVVLETLIRPGE